MRVTLIDAGHPTHGRSWTNWTDGDRFAMPSSGLVSIGSLCREHDQLEIIDEKVEGAVDPSRIDADLVGISFKTMYAAHAYRLADDLRARGIPVVLGGVHASNMPEEAAEHADAVCVGEGEPVWRQILEDVEAGQPRRFYRAPVAPRGRLDTLPWQRFELLKTERYLTHAVQSARGCSFDCEFCPTRMMFGSTYRLRSVDAIVAEVAHLVALEDKPVFFTENVFGAGDRAFIEELAGKLHALGAQWAVICDWVMVRPDIMKILAANGCMLVCINLTGRRTDEELAALKAIHDTGMQVWGYFMFGFEEDGPDVFEGAIRTVRTYDIACTSLTVLTPFPGTPMGRRLEREGRITSRDLNHYDHCTVAMQPMGMTLDQLQQGFDYVCRELADRSDFVNAVRAITGRSLPKPMLAR